MSQFDFDFTKEKLSQIVRGNPNIDEWYDALCLLLPVYEINTVNRTSAFLAQCAHESGEFKILKENLNYNADGLRRVFSKYFPDMELAATYARQPEKIANRVYASRMGNGDAASGDGFRYCGRGLIQLTGKTNYTKFAESISVPVEEAALYLNTIKGAAESACWYWKVNNLNKFADSGDIETMTKRINGGSFGLVERKKYYAKALQILSG